MRTFAVRIAIVALVSVSPVVLAEEYIKPGLYKITTTVASDQFPMMNRNTASNECFTEEDIDGRNPAALLDQAGESCDVSEYEFEDGKLSIKMTCAEQGGSMTMNSQGTYHSTGYAMTTQMQMSMAGFTMDVNGSVTGERVGECQ